MRSPVYALSVLEYLVPSVIRNHRKHTYFSAIAARQPSVRGPAPEAASSGSLTLFVGNLLIITFYWLAYPAVGVQRASVRSVDLAPATLSMRCQ